LTKLLRRTNKKSHRDVPNHLDATFLQQVIAHFLFQSKQSYAARRVETRFRRALNALISKMERGEQPIRRPAPSRQKEKPSEKITPESKYLSTAFTPVVGMSVSTYLTPAVIGPKLAEAPIDQSQ